MIGKCLGGNTMKKIVILFCTILFLCGCFAIIDDTSGTRRVNSFGVSKEESLYIIEQVNSKSDDEKKVIKFLSRKEE